MYNVLLTILTIIDKSKIFQTGKGYPSLYTMTAENIFQSIIVQFNFFFQEMDYISYINPVVLGGAWVAQSVERPTLGFRS